MAQAPSLSAEIQAYNNLQSATHKETCDLLSAQITKHLPEAENKIWHRHPVWFINGNPITGYSVQKAGVRLMFWSGKSFGEEMLSKRGEKFQDASVFYNEVKEINKNDLKRWLQKARNIQWDYKNIVKRKGKLEKLTEFG